MNFYRFKAILFIFFSCFLLQTALFAQSNPKITIKKKNVTLEEALHEVEKQSTYMVAFNESKLDKTKRVDLNINAQPLEKALTTILSGTGQTFKIRDKYIMIIPVSKSAPEKKKITGVVKDTNGEPLIGVNVSVRGSSMGTITNMDGEFSLQAAKGDVIEFSYIGYTSSYQKIADAASLTVVMGEDAQALDEVVVTALGIKRSEKALSYNIQKVKSEDITGVKDANFVNSLNGKVAGVTINRSSAGAGGATRVIMRGAKSMVGNNNVLYVIDGMSIGNPSKGEVKDEFSGPGSGEGISDFNPDDIESISVLTSPSAAALYGSSAANGVILITTKKGQEGKLKVSVSNNTDFSSAYIMPEFQNQYGNRASSYKSWGEKLSTPSNFNPKDFFQNGTNVMNSISLSTGTKNNQTFFSAATTNSKGIIPNNEYYRYNFTLRNTATMLNDRLHLDLSASYVMQGNQNMLSQGRYFNPLLPLYLFPRGEDFESVKIFERYDAERKFPVQEWPYGDQGISLENPYWIVNREMFVSNKKRYMFYANAKYDILDWLNISGRIRVDNTHTTTERRLSASTLLLHAQSDKGHYTKGMEEYRQTYGDIMLNINKALGDFNLTANIGASYEDHYTTGINIGGKLFTVPNLFSSYNFDPSSGPGTESYSRNRTIGAFVSAELGYKSMIYLTLTGRNDWASQLVNTNHPSVFYPSIGLSGVITEMVKLPEFISFLKVRASYTEVGSPISKQGLTPGTVTDNMVGGIINPNSIYPFPDFEPERTKSYELGVNLRLWDNRINVDATFYQSNTYKQLFLSSLPPTSGYSGFYVQTGNVRNRGIELSIGFNDKFGAFGYSTNVVYTTNENKILRMARGYVNPIDNSTFDITELSLAEAGGVYLREGGSIGDVYVKGILQRDRNHQLVEEGGGYKIDRSQRIKIGSVNPDYTIGWRNDFSWKGFNLGLLFNVRVGGIVTSYTQAYMDAYGVSKESFKARENGGVWVDGVQYDAEKYYNTVGGQNLMAYYTYSATNIRLEEASLSYTLPKKWFGNVIQRMTIATIGRNLLMIYRKAPFDPEMVSSTGTYNRGDFFMPPSLRNVGFSVKIDF